MTNLREIAEDYLHLAQDADGNVDRLRRKRYEQLVQLAEALKKMPQSYRYANPTAFATAFEKWHGKFRQ